MAGINIREAEYTKIEHEFMNQIFKSLADSTRLRVLHLLANRGPEICVCDLVSALDLPQGTVSRHLMHLRYLGLVRDRRQGTWIHYSLAEPTGQLHAGLLQCLRTCCGEEKQLTQDLHHFDRLHQQGTLACCVQPSVNNGKGPQLAPKLEATTSTPDRKKSHARTKV